MMHIKLLEFKKITVCIYRVNHSTYEIDDYVDINTLQPPECFNSSIDILLSNPQRRPPSSISGGECHLLITKAKKQSKFTNRQKYRIL